MITHSQPTIEKSDIAAVTNVLRSRQIASGGLAQQFREDLRKFFKAKLAVLTPSGTAAMIKALQLLNIKRRDEVIIPAYVCSSVARAVIASGATPRVVDINRQDYNIAYHDVVKKINKNTKAIIIPHIFGNPAADIKKFLKLGVVIIEDVAQAIGGTCDGKRLGSFGDMAICSFYATKMITTGEGGALIINNTELSKRFIPDSHLYKMTDIQAALGISQLKKIDGFIHKRQKLFAQYFEGFQNNNACLISNPKNSIHYRCIIEVNKSLLRSGIDKMRQRDIMASHFSDLVINYLRLPAKDYPNTKYAIDRVVSLPLYPALTKFEVNSIIESSKKDFIIDKNRKK